MRSEWQAFAERLERRLIRSLDVASILILDAIILVLGYVILWFVNKVTSDEDAFFNVAKAISHGTLVLLYLCWAVSDVWEFLRHEADGQ
jgi:hypothetical protein